ncbi:MAG: hypothetical protein AB3N13_11785, partial [Arenibacterium sp.]
SGSSAITLVASASAFLKGSAGLSFFFAMVGLGVAKLKGATYVDCAVKTIARAGKIPGLIPGRWLSGSQTKNFLDIYVQMRMIHTSVASDDDVMGG